MRLTRPAPTALILLAALLAALGSTATGAAERNTLLPPGESRYRPTREPDRVILLATADPARTAAVTWRTDPSVRDHMATTRRPLADAARAAS